MLEGKKLEVDEYHGHQNYIVIWGFLIILFNISLMVGATGNYGISMFLIFLIGVIKATYVIQRFMHLKWEPLLYKAVLGFSILVLLFLFFGIAPDIIFKELVMAK
ncbi:MAG: cytochrome c oxidase subunit IV [Candidatus Marinamargulisbacteria bacterium]